MLIDKQIIYERDECLPSQGEKFDCIAFARRIEALAREQMLEECIAACDEVCECPTIEKNIQALQGVEDCINAIRALGATP